MRLIKLPKSTYDAIIGLPENILVSQIKLFQPSRQTLKYRNYKQGYSLKNNLLLEYSDSHLQTLIQVLFDLEPKEYCYRDFLYHEFPGSKMEVPIDTGIVDIMTNTHVIEVKKAPQWKHSLGQVLSYSFSTNLLPAVALIGPTPQVAKDVLKYYQVDLIELP